MAKRMSLLVAILALVAVGLFAGGQGEGAEAQGGEQAEVNPMGVFPIVDEPVTLNVFTFTAPFDIETNAFTQWLEETTNVQIAWELVPGDSLVEKRNLLLSSGDLPDVFLSADLSPSLEQVYGSQGVLVPLNDLIDEYGEETQAMFEQFPTVERRVTMPDGNIYALPKINECFHCEYYRGRFWIYEPWLDALDLEMPTTLDEFRDVMIAFKERDPNGNGEADEIPLSFAMGRNYYNNDASIDVFLMQPFIYNDAKDRLILNGDEVEVIYNTNEWRDGLRFLNQLYEDGVLHQEGFVQDFDQLNALGENETPILGAAPSGHAARFTQYRGASGRFLEYKALAPLMGPDGTRQTEYDPYFAGRTGTVAITSAANAAVAFRWADIQLGEEATLRSWQGRPGVEWDWADDGQVGVNGEPAVWQTLIDTYDQAQNARWDQRGLTNRTARLRLGQAVDAAARAETIEGILYDVSAELYQPYAPSVDIIVPPLLFNEETAAELADLRTTLTNFWQESMAQFILGDLDIDSNADWNRYLNELENIGLVRYEDLLTDAYQAQYQ